MPPTESWRRFLALFETAPDAILIADDRTRYVDANPAACTLLGYSREEFLRIGVIDVMPPEDRAAFADVWAEFQRAGTIAAESEVVCKDGTRRTVEGRAVAHFVPGLHVSFLRDVTARKRADTEFRRQKELLQTIVDHIPIVLNIVDADGRIQWINNEWQRVLGWSLEEAQTRDVLRDIYPDPATYERVREHIREAAPGWIDVRARRKDGHVIDITWAAVRLSDGYVIRIGQDVTERKRGEDELQASREQLRRVSARLDQTRERERTELARELHDELGQLLTALKMDLTWLRDRVPGESPHAAALRDKADTMADTIDRTIQRVRDISAGLRPSVLDRLGLLEAIEWQAQDFERRSGISCRFESQIDRLDVEADHATQVFRIVQEALTNTVRHAGATRVTISVRTRGRRLLLEIRDNGQGISDDSIADPNSLGLLGMRERARLAGGDLTIGRAARKGTVVAVSIPIKARGGGSNPEA